MYAGARVGRPGLDAAAVQHHRRRFGGHGHRRGQPLLLKGGHVLVASRGPFAAHTHAQTPQVHGAERHVRQGLEIGAGLGKGLLGSLTDRQADDGRAEAFLGQAQLVIEGGKTRPDRSCSGTVRGAVRAVRPG
jgi:hypothetical protein